MQTETNVVTPPAAQPPRHADAVGRRLAVPILEPTPGGFADRLSQRIGPTNPVRVFAVVMLAGYVLLVSAMVLLGVLLFEVLLPAGLEKADDDFIQWLVDNRSPTQEDLSWVGSTLAGGHVVPAVIGLGLVVFLLTKHWLLAAYVLFTVAVESGAYRATSLFLERERPDVERLEDLPVEAAYPSGHTAAAVALWGGLLLLLASRIENRAVGIGALILAITIALFVGWSRMYRGMHHPSDVVAGILMGIGALVVVVLAARASRAAAQRRDAVEALPGGAS